MSMSAPYWDSDPVDPSSLIARGVVVCTSDGTVVATGGDVYRISVTDPEVVRQRALKKGEDPHAAVASIPPDRLWLRSPLSPGSLIEKGEKKRFNPAKGKQPCEALVSGKRVGVWWDDYSDGVDGTPLQVELWLQPRGGCDFVYLADSSGRKLSPTVMTSLFPRRS